MRDDERQRILMLRADVNELNVEPVDLGDEVRIGIQLRFDLAPVVFGLPVADELLNRREPHALRIVADGLLLGQACRGQAISEIDQGFLRNVDAEGPDGVAPVVCRDRVVGQGGGNEKGFRHHDRVHWWFSLSGLLARFNAARLDRAIINCTATLAKSSAYDYTVYQLFVRKLMAAIRLPLEALMALAKQPPAADPSEAQNLDDFLCFAIYSTNLAVNRLNKTVLDELGLTYLQYVALVLLYEHNDQ